MKNGILILATCAVLGFAARAADVPYAFTYAGKPATWLDAAPCVQKTVLDTDRLTKSVREWKSLDGKLTLRSTETTYKKFPVREYLPELVCAGDAPTEIVDGFQSVHVARRASGAVLRALRGTVCTEKDFEPVTVAFGGPGATNAYSFVATEGR